MAPKQYINQMIGTYEQIFSTKSRMIYSSPLEQGDHPELDSSDEFDQQGVQTYQLLIGAAQ